MGGGRDPRRNQPKLTFSTHLWPLDSDQRISYLMAINNIFILFQYHKGILCYERWFTSVTHLPLDCCTSLPSSVLYNQVIS